MYMQGTDTLTDDDIASSGVALIIAGNDTSGLGIMGMLGLLALQPEVMDKLRKEQQQVSIIHLLSLQCQHTCCVFSSLTFVCL